MPWSADGECGVRSIKYTIYCLKDLARMWSDAAYGAERARRRT